jgi:hypothetical protein
VTQREREREREMKEAGDMFLSLREKDDSQM